MTTKMNIVSYNLNGAEFLIKHRKVIEDILPIKKLNDIHDFLINRQIYVSQYITDPHRDSLFFFDLITKLKKNNIGFVTNYTIYNEDLGRLSKNYKGEILIEKHNKNAIYFEINNTIVDKSSECSLEGQLWLIDWYDIWGHCCSGWVMNSKAYNIFKRLLDNKLSKNDINDFFDNLEFYFEYGDIHESILFISFNDKLTKVLK